MLAETKLQLAVLGAGEAPTRTVLPLAGAGIPGRVAAEIGYSDELSHRIQAGADFFLMPSLFEPCGLTQLYSLRYGTLPVVHATGGLEDTIEQYNEGEGRGPGFKFYTPDGGGVPGRARWAVDTWYERPSHVTAMREQAMRVRFEWETSARRYLDVYRRALAKRGA
jgi:starch synthase